MFYTRRELNEIAISKNVSQTNAPNLLKQLKISEKKIETKRREENNDIIGKDEDEENQDNSNHALIKYLILCH